MPHPLGMIMLLICNISAYGMLWSPITLVIFISGLHPCVTCVTSCCITQTRSTIGYSRIVYLYSNVF